MTRKLEQQKSLDIIKEALEDIRPNEQAHPDETLGKLMPLAADRERFRETVTRLVKQQTFTIDSAALSVSPHFRLKDIARTLSEMAGDPYTTRPHGIPEPSPAPREKPVYPKPGKRKAAEITADPYTSKPREKKQEEPL